jgi:hypothetical protein
MIAPSCPFLHEKMNGVLGSGSDTIGIARIISSAVVTELWYPFFSSNIP